jgi:hypothetical protein
VYATLAEQLGQVEPSGGFRFTPPPLHPIIVDCADALDVGENAKGQLPCFANIAPVACAP